MNLCATITHDIIQRDSDRDFFMGPEVAKSYSLIDEVLKRNWA